MRCRVTTLHARETLRVSQTPPWRRPLSKSCTTSIWSSAPSTANRSTPRRLVESTRDAPPCLAVVGHVEVLVAVELALVELLVDVGHDGDPWVGVLREEEIREHGERLELGLGEEPDLRHLVDAPEDHLSRHLVPVVLLLEDVVVGIAPVHLGRNAASLPRQVVGVGMRLFGKAAVRQVMRLAEIRGHYFS